MTCVYIYIHINQYVAHLSIVNFFYDRAMASQKEFKDDDIYDDPAVFFSWQCSLCKKWAKDGLSLEDQFLGGSVVALFDSDNDIWIHCDDCAASFHANCLTHLLNKPELNAYEINLMGRFSCCVTE